MKTNMAALRVTLSNSRRLNTFFTKTTAVNFKKCFTTDAGDVNAEKKPKISGFAQSWLRQQQPEIEPTNPADEQTFASLLRNSKFIDLGDPEGRVVTGKIFHVVNDDLYIDFGWKFHTVCTKPSKNSEDYVRGATVRLRIKDLELSSRFLGSKNDILLLEADCTLLGLINSPARPR